LDYFFVGPRKRPVVAVARRSERQRFNGLQEGDRTMFQFESLDFRATEKRLSAYWAEFDDAGAVPLSTHSHGGVELLYVLRGKLAIEIDGTAYELAQGDAIYFESEVPHRYRKLGRGPAEAVVVTTP
jgi:mannose-6-phosphate isomerase-like protein (cupin superfamily)